MTTGKTFGKFFGERATGLELWCLPNMLPNKNCAMCLDMKLTSRCYPETLPGDGKSCKAGHNKPNDLGKKYLLFAPSFALPSSCVARCLTCLICTILVSGKEERQEAEARKISKLEEVSSCIKGRASRC